MDILSTNIDNIDDVLQSFRKFLGIISILRSPDGCPWDRKQTPASMREHLLEEMHELIEAMNSKDAKHICEEMGDVFLLLGMLSLMYKEQKKFDLDAVIEGLNAKLLLRHPHVFGDAEKTTDPDEAIENWDTVKKVVEGRGASHTSILDGIPSTLPSLDKAYKLQLKAAKNGFDWKDGNGAKEKILEELDEISRADNADEQEEEIGDLFFSVANYARHRGCNPALALMRANVKFEQRFRQMEAALLKDGISMNADNLEVMERYWEAAKKAVADAHSKKA